MKNPNEKIAELKMTSIILHPDLETRRHIDGEHLDNLEAAIKNGETMPPIIVIPSDHPEKYHIVDGKLRFSNKKHQGAITIQAVIFEGSFRDAIIYRISVNSKHGQNYSKAERIENVKKLLSDSKWSKWSNRHIARICGVNERSVRNYRKKMRNSNNSLTADSPQLINYFRNGQHRQMRKPQISIGQTSTLNSSNDIEIQNTFDNYVPHSNIVENVENTEDSCSENQSDILQRQYNVQSGDVFIAETDFEGERNRKHILVCGNSKSIDYKLLLAQFLEEKANENPIAELLLTDPPYNVDYDSKKSTSQVGNHRLQKIANDNLSNDDYQKFLESVFKNCSNFLSPGSMFVVWYGFKMTVETFTAITTTLGQCRQQIFWEKINPRPDNSKFIWATESAITGWTGNEGRRYKYEGKLPRNTFHSKDFKKSQHELPNGYHPCRKPVAILGRLIELCVEKNAIVLDPFAGSGTVAVAAELTSRQSISIELEPAFVAVILWRFEKLGHRITRTKIDDL